MEGMAVVTVPVVTVSGVTVQVTVDMAVDMVDTVDMPGVTVQVVMDKDTRHIEALPLCHSASRTRPMNETLEMTMKWRLGNDGFDKKYFEALSLNISGPNAEGVNYNKDADV